jgi:dephospho-CoA kinase
MAIIITGGICTGKSTVCKMFEKNGYEIVDADKIAHKLLDENLEPIEKLFGKKYIKNDKIDRKRLGQLIFSDREKKKELESLLHPKIREEIKKESQRLENNHKKYLIDIPLFFESNSYEADKVIVVYASKQLQINRLIKRDDLTKDEANKRVESQMNIEKKRELADFLLDNSKDLQHLGNEVKRLIKFMGENSANFKI